MLEKRLDGAGSFAVLSAQFILGGVETRKRFGV
jgi:hypothetical protein